MLTAITVWCIHNGAEAFMKLLPAVRVENLSAYELQIMSQHAKVLEHPAAVKQLETALAAVYSPASPPRGRTRCRPEDILQRCLDTLFLLPQSKHRCDHSNATSCFVAHLGTCSLVRCWAAKFSEGCCAFSRKLRSVVTTEPSCSREAAFVRERRPPLCLGAGRLVARVSTLSAIS